MNAAAVATLDAAPGPLRRGNLGELGLVPNGAVAVRDGRIVDVGPTRRLRGRHDAEELVDAEGGLVTPGFVDPHTHLPFAGNRAFELQYKLAGRSYEDILQAGGGIHRTVRDTRAASLKELSSLLRRRAQTMLEWGTTTAEAKSGYGLDARTEYKQLQAIARVGQEAGLELVPTFLGAHAVPQDQNGGRGEWVRQIVEQIIPHLAQNGLARFVDVFLERSAYNRAEARSILEAARANGLLTKLHADEFTNQRGAELASELGATSAEHLLEVSPRGIQRLARSSTVAVLLPGVAALGFLERQAPAREMVQAGVAVALGTDFNPNCPVLTVPTILQWGVYELRLTPAEALAAATTNAAFAVGLGDRVGRLAAGYQADLLVHNVPSVDELAYWVGANPVRTVVKRGRVAFDRSAGISRVSAAADVRKRRRAQRGNS